MPLQENISGNHMNTSDTISRNDKCILLHNLVQSMFHWRNSVNKITDDVNEMIRLLLLEWMLSKVNRNVRDDV